MISFNKKFFCIFCIFIIALTARFIAINYKSGFFIDEVFTFVVTSPNNLSPEGFKCKDTWSQVTFQSSKNYTAKQIRKSLFETKADFNSVIQDIKTIRNANIDTQHTNIYYSLLRIWNIGVKGTDLNQLKNRSCCLNIIFFCFSFFFLYKLLSLIKNDTKFISLGLFFAFLSSGSICNTLLIRDYQLMESFLIGTVLVSFIFVKSIINNSSVSLKQILSFAFVLAIFTLSSYFSLCFSVLLFLSLFSFCIFQKKYNYIKFIPIILFVAFLFIILIYPSYFNLELNGVKFNTTQITFALSFVLEKILKSFKVTYFYLGYFMFYKEILYIIGVFILLSAIKPFKNIFTDNTKLNKKEIFTLIIIILLFNIFCLINNYFAPFLHVRFILPAFPILASLFIILLYRFKKLLIISFMTIYLIISYCSFFYIDKYAAETFSFTKHSIPFYDMLPNNIKPNSIPVIVIQDPDMLFSVYVTQIIDENTIVRFEDEIPDENYFFDEYIIILNNKYTVLNNKEIFRNDTLPLKKVKIVQNCNSQKCYFKKNIN